MARKTKKVNPSAINGTLGTFFYDDAEFIYLETRPGVKTPIEKIKIIDRKNIRISEE